MTSRADNPKSKQISDAKADIVNLAQTFSGRGDPDFSKQESLEPLIKRLLELNPMPPVSDRLDLVAGAWKQVWGNYDYRNDKRGVDPEIGTEEIYQVIHEDGYYYNISPLYRNGAKNSEQIGLLRGRYQLEPGEPNMLSVKFTSYPGASARIEGVELWQMGTLVEQGTLSNQVTIVPSWIVTLFFKPGRLEEVYTDHDLRICYGTRAGSSSKSLFIMTRVQ